MNRTAFSLAIAGSVLGALAGSPAAAADKSENCYGVSVKGQNDCASTKHGCSGQASADYDPSDWKSVPHGTCEKMTVNGHKGSLTAS